MKLKTCLEIGKECGLTTVKEAVMNISYHAINIFVYDKIKEEMYELEGELDEAGIDNNTLITDILSS